LKADEYKKLGLVVDALHSADMLEELLHFQQPALISLRETRHY
jgi:hypothetical protein